jgi:sugar (pentulose or hexulose) kinase
MKFANFVAIDLGASNGRVFNASWNGKTFNLRELHRFANSSVDVLGRLHWDVLRLWSEIKNGLSSYSREYQSIPAGIGVDAWGVDFALLDAEGSLLGNPHTYRDRRTEGIPGTGNLPGNRNSIMPHKHCLPNLQYGPKQRSSTGSGRYYAHDSRFI